MRVTVTVDIDAPVSDVWADVSDLSSHASWMADVESIRFVGDRHSGVGTILRVPTRVGPFRTDDWIIVTDWEAPHRIGVLHAGFITGFGTFTLTGRGSTTRFTWDEVLQLPMALGGPIAEAVAGPILAAIWRSNLRRLASRFA